MDQGHVNTWLQAARDALAELATSQGESLREYATTLLGAVVAPTHSVFFQIGDGAIVVRPTPADGWCFIVWPQHGDYANTTHFLTQDDALERVAVEACQGPIQDMAVFSDGIEGLVLHAASRTVHAPFFDSMITPVRALGDPGPSSELSSALAEYLESAAVCARTDDDKTLILASCRSEP
jgi:hypothetical protein